MFGIRMHEDFLVLWFILQFQNIFSRDQTKPNKFVNHLLKYPSKFLNKVQDGGQWFGLGQKRKEEDYYEAKYKRLTCTGKIIETINKVNYITISNACPQLSVLPLKPA